MSTDYIVKISFDKIYNIKKHPLIQTRTVYITYIYAHIYMNKYLYRRERKLKVLTKK